MSLFSSSACILCIHPHWLLASSRFFCHQIKRIASEWKHSVKAGLQQKLQAAALLWSSAYGLFMTCYDNVWSCFTRVSTGCRFECHEVDDWWWDNILFCIQTVFFCVNTLMQEEFRERKQELDRKLERVGGLKKCWKTCNHRVLSACAYAEFCRKQTDLFMFEEKSGLNINIISNFPLCHGAMEEFTTGKIVLHRILGEQIPLLKRWLDRSEPGQVADYALPACFLLAAPRGDSVVSSRGTKRGWC